MMPIHNHEKTNIEKRKEQIMKHYEISAFLLIAPLWLSHRLLALNLFEITSKNKMTIANLVKHLAMMMVHLLVLVMPLTTFAGLVFFLGNTVWAMGALVIATIQDGQEATRRQGTFLQKPPAEQLVVSHPSSFSDLNQIPSSSYRAIMLSTTSSFADQSLNNMPFDRDATDSVIKIASNKSMPLKSPEVIKRLNDSIPIDQSLEKRKLSDTLSLQIDQSTYSMMSSSA